MFSLLNGVAAAADAAPGRTAFLAAWESGAVPVGAFVLPGRNAAKKVVDGLNPAAKGAVPAMVAVLEAVETVKPALTADSDAEAGAAAIAALPAPVRESPSFQRMLLCASIDSCIANGVESADAVRPVIVGLAPALRALVAPSASSPAAGAFLVAGIQVLCASNEELPPTAAAAVLDVLVRPGTGDAILAPAALQAWAAAPAPVESFGREAALKACEALLAATR